MDIAFMPFSENKRTKDKGKEGNKRVSMGSEEERRRCVTLK